MDTNGKFYLGRLYDPVEGKTTRQPLFYDPSDLTTHAVVVGMTGSGKTGLCMCLLEEAALGGFPALMIDPKGDITNALLHFPDLLPRDFQPWVNPDQARREGKTVEQLAIEVASRWQEGLAEWDISPDRLRALQNAALFTVFTPGSDAGVPVNILASLKAPLIAWEANRELLRERISGTVTALLGLVGLGDIDPVRSREHILLANVFEHAWSQGKDLDLGELIMQTQNPPFSKLGVFDVNTFFPEKDRFSLAMQLNNILAAPAFQPWIEGQPLDIPTLLFAPDGRPRHSVFYIAHLSDTERMFFVTLLYAAVETWMRSQPGTTSLRAILYFDEIFGYLPPVSNPPSKQPMLRMLKQARAFGVGQVLVTQNPVDVDYKALSNAGTWFIGKLQTEQDKSRLLDGLESAMSGRLNRREYDRLISSLGKRVFLVHNVHAAKPELVQTRWAMNFLAGPLTRTQIPALNELVGVAVSPGGLAPQAAVASPGLAGAQSVLTMAEREMPSADAVPGVSGPALEAPTGTTTRPVVPTGINEFFLPNNLTFTQAFKEAGRSYPAEAYSIGLIYRPVILAQAAVRFLNRKYNLDTEIFKTALVPEPNRRGVVRWEQFAASSVEHRDLDHSPHPQARFASLDAPLTDRNLMSAMSKDFLDWSFRVTQATVRANEALRLYAGPDTSSAGFRSLCAEAAREQRDAEIKKVSDSYERKLDVLRGRMAREERELAGDESELSQRKMEELGTHAENVLSLFSKRSSRRLTTSLTKRRLTEKAKAAVDESVKAIADFKKQIEALEKEKDQELESVNQRWGELANQVTEMQVPPLKKDVILDMFGVAWMPFHLVQIGESVEELPGYATG